MSQDREQAIKDVAEALAYTERMHPEDALTCAMGYTALQRERVIALERALREVEEILNPDKEDGYRADDPEGAMDTAHSKARAALNGERQ